MKSYCLILFILLTNCASVSKENTAESVNKLKQNTLTQTDVLVCSNIGGIVKNVCMKGIPVCIQTYKDAGKVCNDGSDCYGDCRIETKFVEEGSTTSGFCNVDDNPCGCFQLVIEGRAQHVLCTD